MKPVIGIIQEVQIEKPDGSFLTIMAKVDTGAHASSISHELAEKILLHKAPVIHKRFASAFGYERRPVYEVNLVIKGKHIKTQVSVAKRSHLTLPLLLGVRALQHVLIDPSLPHDVLHKKTTPC